MENGLRHDAVTLAMTPGVGPVLFTRLVAQFGSPTAVFQARPAELRAVEEMTQAAASGIVNRVAAPVADAEMAKAAEAGATLLLISDPAYPARLREIYDPPPLLYMKGGLVPDDARAVAIVGSRRYTEYGRWVTERLSRDLAACGLTIVSGMARGIDGAAHEAALRAGGRTIAVLGSGIDVCYPREHAGLMAEIVVHGAVVTEFPIGTPPEADHFPRRNRVISGLSLGVVIVEASEQSGSLITARLALDQGREVFAVPGSIGSRTSAGTNRLIKQGARLVEQAEDILEELRPHLGDLARPGAAAIPVEEGTEAGAEGAKGDNLGAEEARLYGFLTDQPRHIDDLIGRVRMPAQQVSTLLLGLELKGRARQLPGHLYVKVPVARITTPGDSEPSWPSR